MKKILLLGALVIGSVLINKADAQQFGISATIGIQPDWGPYGYNNAEYYYLPDIEAYYCIPTREFTWFENGQWISSPYLPQCYANYDLYSGYKVVLNERDPWWHFNEHRRIYAPFRYRHDQVIIRDYRGGRGYYGGGYARPDYYENRGGYERHGDWDRNRGYDERGRDGGREEHGRGYDHDNGRGHGYGHDRGRW